MSDKKSNSTPLTESTIKKGGLNSPPKTPKPTFVPKPLTSINSNASQNSSNSTSKND